MADGKHIEVAKAYVTIVPSLEGSQKTIATEMGAAVEPAAKQAGEKGGKNLGESLAKGLKTTTAVIGAAMAAATASVVATGKAFISAANSTAQYGDKIDKMSQKMGISTKAYQEWDFILQHSGSSIDGLKKGLTNVSTAMGELADASTKTIDTAQINKTKLAYDKAALSVKDAQKAYKNAVKEHGKNSTEAQKAAIKVKDAQLKASEAQNAYAVACEGSSPKISNAASAIQSLGVKTTDASGKLRAQEDVFSDIVTALQGIENESDRTAKAVAIFGKGAAADLGPLLNTTAKDTEAMKKQINELGGVMSDDAIKAAANYQDEMQNMNTALTGVKNNIMSQFLPGMSAVMQGLSKVFSGDKSGMGAITTGIQSVIQNITAMAPQFITIISTIVNSLITAFGPMLPQLVAALFGFITQVLTTFTTMIPQLTPVITMGLQGIAQALLTCLPVLIQGLMGVITGIVTWLSSGDNVKTFVDGILQLVSTLAEGFADMLPILLPAIVNIIGQISDSLTQPKNVQMIITSVLYIVGAIIVALVKALPEIGGVIVKTFTNLGKLLKECGGAIIETIGPFFTKLWNDVSAKLGAFVASVFTKLKELPRNVVQIGKDLITGLWNGINDKIKWVKDKIAGMGQSITNAIKKVFGVHSPSKVFAEIGGFLAEGLGVGFESEIGDVESDMAKSMNGLTGNMTATVSAQGAPGDLMGNTTNYNGGAVTINVYGAEGQSVNELADVIAIKLQEMTTRRSAVYA